MFQSASTSRSFSQRVQRGRVLCTARAVSFGGRKACAVNPEYLEQASRSIQTLHLALAPARAVWPSPLHASMLLAAELHNGKHAGTEAQQHCCRNSTLQWQTPCPEGICDPRGQRNTLQVAL